MSSRKKHKRPPNTPNIEELGYERFKKYIREYEDLHHQIREANKALRVVRKRKTEIEKFIKEYMILQQRDTFVTPRGTLHFDPVNDKPLSYIDNNK